MCMKNVNALASIEAINENDKISTVIDKDRKVISFSETNKLFVSTAISIIDGTEHFFSKHEEITFQVRITDSLGNNGQNIVLDEFTIDMLNTDKIFTTEFVDFIYDKSLALKEFNKDIIDLETQYFVSILIKTKDDLAIGKNWTVQSMMPIYFVE